MKVNIGDKVLVKLRRGKTIKVAIYMGQAFADPSFKAHAVELIKSKNAASYLIASSLKMLEPKPCAVISYADSAHGHCGIIYQATNWIYTGATKSHDSLYIVDGEKLHPMTIRDKFGVTNHKEWAKSNGVEISKPELKHRYFYLIGNKTQKRNMKSKLRYAQVNDYPKSDKKMYDDGDDIVMEVTKQKTINITTVSFF